MTTIARTKENGCEFSLFKTPLRTPVRNGMLSSATLNDLASYSNSHNKHLKFINAASVNDLQMCSESITTPIRFNKTKLATPVSTQRRRALGLVNHNSNQLCRTSSNEDLLGLNALKGMNNNKCDEPAIAQTTLKHPEDDLPHNIHSYPDTFDDLIPVNERVEYMVRNQSNGVNFFSNIGPLENTIRCQSPVCNYINVSTLLDMVENP